MRARWFVLLLVSATASAADTFHDTFQYVDTDGPDSDTTDSDRGGDTSGQVVDTDTSLPYPSGGQLAAELAGEKGGCACDTRGGPGAVGALLAVIGLVGLLRRDPA
jgi:MYXO-CTERM domain-containing protein